MTPERNPKALTVENVGHGIGVSIPSDDDSPYILEMLFQHTDIRSFRIADTTAQVYLLAIRFTGQFGGGTIPIIAEELARICEEEEKENFELVVYPTEDDQVPVDIDSIIKVQSNLEGYKYKIENIPDDQGVRPVGFLDIMVSRNGDVTIAQRNARHPGEAKMLFKTRENGGSNPVVAEAFTKVAERIVAAAEKQRKEALEYIARVAKKTERKKAK